MNLNLDVILDLLYVVVCGSLFALLAIVCQLELALLAIVLYAS